jgi:hypothetical protein
MDEKEEQRLRLEREIGVRDLTPEEIQQMFEKDREMEALVRERYPDYFAPPNQQPEA